MYRVKFLNVFRRTKPNNCNLVAYEGSDIADEYMTDGLVFAMPDQEIALALQLLVKKPLTIGHEKSFGARDRILTRNPRF